MPGVTKHIYDHEIRDIMTMWNHQIKSIQLVLPKYYTEADIVSTLKNYYPHEWNSAEFKYSYYQTKDKYLNNRFGKMRYCMKKPEILLLNVSIYKKIVLPEYRKAHSDNYSEKNVLLQKKNYGQKENRK